jgi:MGT family glycosyltransferase
MTTRPLRFLMTTWDGGGNSPPEFGVARRLAERGHQVHILGDPTLLQDAGAAVDAGCTFAPWTSAPHRTTLSKDDDLLKDWEAEDPIDVLRRLRDQIMSGPASEFAAETAACIETFRPDVVLVDGQLFGSVIAAEAAGLPVAVLIPTLWTIPTAGVGDEAVRILVQRLVNGGLGDLNAARSELSLKPLASFYDQLLLADLVLVLASASFDPASAHVPDNVHYVGPVLEDPAWVGPWSPPWSGDASEPLVLVGLSSIYQDQAPLLQHAIDAVSGMEVRAVVTLGRMLEPSDVVAAPHVTVLRSAPYSVLLPDTSVVVTACGHGTVMKTLSAGVPMVCIPMGREQDVIAARVVELGTGVLLSPSASEADIRRAVEKVLRDDGYRSRAQQLAANLSGEHRGFDVVLALEDLAGPGPTDRD